MEEETAMREKFAEVLREMRQASGMTQEQLGARIGKTKQAVSRYENGAYYPAMPVIREIAEVCGYAMGEVFDLAAKKLVIVKSSNHFSAAFAKVCAAVHYLDTGGPFPHDPLTVTYRRVRRPIAPLDAHPWP